ncbi:MAG TPA: methyltransferase domain-containing protein [Syntrophorhabdaceae bacterium]|nr:methyltransferase domain-containing protein [Syntrophorhabdaceae bacterium]
MKRKSGYVHGYSDREHSRLHDQANTLTELLHGDTFYAANSTVLEAGCGVGAQTVILAERSPDAEILAIDLSQESINEAKALIEKQGISNVRFELGDIYHLNLPDESFDHVFVCFVLEHCIRPLDALVHLKRVLKPEGSITVIEGDHGSTYFYPESAEAQKVIQCLIDLQGGIGGNALIGRQVYPLLKAAGFRNMKVMPRIVYVDSRSPELVQGFTKNTFIAMVEGVRERALRFGIIDEEAWERGIRGLNRTTEKDGTFCYTFFKGVAIK